MNGHPDIDVRPMRLPGRDGREGMSAFTTMDALVTWAAEELSAVAGRPFALFGHSLGAVVSFELSRRLSSTNAPVVLFVSASPAPPEVAAASRERHLLPDDEFVNELQQLDGTPPGLLDDTETRGDIAAASAGRFFCRRDV